jgi:uracil-DNA glycosylase family 4
MRDTNHQRERQLAAIDSAVAACVRCERLTAWRTNAAHDPPRRFEGEDYWARGVPGFGPADARIAVVGLAPAAHGANRTGRMFTGDRSGDWLFRAMCRAGLANRAESVAADDGLELIGARVTAVVRCAPPDNKPLPAERDACIGYLAQELAVLKDARVIVALGAFAWSGVLRVWRGQGVELPRPLPRFAHGAQLDTSAGVVLGSFHPSQQNTFTGRLTEPMFDAVFARAVELAGD